MNELSEKPNFESKRDENCCSKVRKCLRVVAVIVANDNALLLSVLYIFQHIFCKALLVWY